MMYISRSWSMYGFILLGLGFLFFLVLPFKVSALTFTVDDDGGADFSEIQDAINNATSGDTILIFEGTYQENIIVNKSLNLRGNGTDVSTVVSGNSVYGVIDINAESVRIENLTIKGNDTIDMINGSVTKLYGIQLSSSSTTIRNVAFDIDCVNSIILVNGSRNEIVNCSFLNYQSYGIQLYNSTNISIVGCNFSGPGQTSRLSYGIALYDCQSIQIIGTLIRNNHVGIYSTKTHRGGIFNCSIRRNFAYGIDIRGNEWHILSTNITQNTYYGINVDGNGNILENCSISNNGKYHSHSGIRLYGCIANEISHCDIRNNSGNGIYMVRGKDNRIHNSTIVNNKKYGIFGTLDSNTDHQIEDNFFHSNDRGEIYLIYDRESDDERNNIYQFSILLLVLAILLFSLFVVVRIPKSKFQRE